MRNPSTPQAVKTLTRGLGVDAVWDTVGGTNFVGFFVACARLGATVAVFGSPVTENGFALEMNSLSFIFGELNLVGVRAATRRDQQLCVQLLAEGKIKPVIDRCSRFRRLRRRMPTLNGRSKSERSFSSPEHV